MKDNINSYIPQHHTSFQSTKQYARSPQNKVYTNHKYVEQVQQAKQTHNRKNSIEINNLPVNNYVPQQFYEPPSSVTQKQIDLRGSCPNIFRKLQQTNLRTTTQFNPIKLQHKLQQPHYHPNSFYKPTQKVNFNHTQPISTSLVIQNQTNHKLQNSKSLIGSNQQHQPFTTLNQIIFSKQIKKSIENNTINHNVNNMINKSKVINGFEIGKVLGKGKFGQVYIARHQLTGFVVALKRIVKAKVKQFKMIEQLKQQIKLHSKLIHPHIVRFYGFFEQPQDIYLIVQYMNGGTLFDYLTEKQKLSVKQAVDFLRDTISAVEYLHQISIAHRDIKPQNIVLSTEGVSKLCDFGWSAFIQNSRQTYCGTFDYAPPEILERKSYDTSVDIWCIGVLAYELLTGKVPFEGQVRNVIMDKIINVDKNKIQYPVQLPTIAKQFIQDLVKKNASERPKCKDLLKYQLFINNPPKCKKYDVK